MGPVTERSDEKEGRENREKKGRIKIANRRRQKCFSYVVDASST